MHLHRAILRTGTALLEKRQIRHLRAFRMAVVKEGPDVQLFTHPAALTKLALWLGEAIVEQEREHKGGVKRGAKGTPLVVAGLNERRGVYVVVGTGRGGGVTNPLRITNTTTNNNKRKTDEEKEKRRKEREEKKAEKRRAKRAQRISAAAANDDDDNDDDDEDRDTEDDDDDDSSSSTEDEEEDEEEEATAVQQKRGYGLNRFGNAFQEVVDETNARVRIDSFEHCVVEVKIDDLAAFLESLSMKAVVG